MKVLHLSPAIPWPADSGGKIGIWNFLRADARFAEVGLLSFTEVPPGRVDAGPLSTVCAEIGMVERPRTLDGVVGGVRSLLSPVAMNLAKYRWGAYSQALGGVMARFRPDIVVAHHLHMAPYLLEVGGAVPILREHNIDSDLMERYAGTLRNPALAAFARRQADKIRRTEAGLCPRVRQCLVITPDDEAKLRAIAPGVRTTIVPGAIDPGEYEALDPPSGRSDLLVAAVGSFGFPPTGEGAVDFVERVWPRVLEAFPNARLRLIGRCPPGLHRRLAAGERVEVLGRVDQVRPHLEGVHVFMVPLRAGSGMRIRILEALAYRIPVVTTTIGCEGIEVDDGRHLLIADSPGDIAGAIGRIYRGPDLAGTLRVEGRRLVERSYSLDTVERLTGRVYRKELQETDATAAAR